MTNENNKHKKYQKTSLAYDAWKRLHRNKLAVAGMVMLLLFVIMAIFAPVIAPYDPIKINWGDEALPPFWMRDLSNQNGTGTIEGQKEQSPDGKSENDVDGGWSDGSGAADQTAAGTEETSSGWTTTEENDSETSDNGWTTGKSDQTGEQNGSEGGWISGAESSTDDNVFQQQIEEKNEESVNRASHVSDNFYLLGTDQMGRDLFSRIIYGARLTLIVGFVSVVISLLIGTILGLVSGYFGGLADTLIMRVMDIVLSFPYILLAIFIVSILGRGLVNAMIAIGVVGIPRFARVVRSQVLSVKEQEYVMASRTLGAGNSWMISRHILVNSLSPLIVQTTMSLASAILNAAALGFLGLGAQAPTPEWGVMLSDARSAMLTAPWVITFPGIAIILCVLGFNLLGDGLRDSLDPRQKR